MNYEYTKINILYFFATIGLMLSLTVHLITFFEYNLTISNVQFIHIGIIIIWLLTIISIVKSLDKKSSKEEYWQKFKKDFPKWIIYIGILVVLYTIFNFLYTHFILSEGVLQDYQRQESYFLRGFSGHWLFFYYIAWAILFKIRKHHEPKK